MQLGQIKSLVYELISTIRYEEDLLRIFDDGCMGIVLIIKR
jgi:hypothetical protein